MNRDNQNVSQSNAGLAMGKPIQVEVLKYERAEYGRQIIATLSQELSAEFGRGYSYSSLTRMVKFHGVATDEEIVAALRRQSGWTNFRTLIRTRRRSPILFALIRTMESSDNRAISRSELSDQALESSEIVRSGLINYQRRFIGRKIMAGTWLSSQGEGRQADNTLRAILENIGI